MRDERRSRMSRVRVSILLASLFITPLLFSQNSFVTLGEIIGPPVHGNSQQLDTTTVISPTVHISNIREFITTDKGNPKLGFFLNRLLETWHYESLPGAKAFADNHNIVFQDNLIQVTIVTSEGSISDVREAVKAIGGGYQLHYRNLLQAMVPISALEGLARRTDIHIIREPLRAIIPPQPISSVISVGNQTSEGVAAANASAFHDAGYDGTGVRVAVIDGGFEGYTGLLGTDLPTSVNTHDWTGSGMEGDLHGTACAEIVYDMAPEITMDLHKINTVIEFGNAVDQTIADDANIISLSLGWLLGEPGDGTGFLADIVANASSNGIFVAKSSGNYAERSWSGKFTDTDNDNFHEWTSGQIVNYFGPGDGLAFVIPVKTRIQVSVQWDDWTDVNQDYALGLLYYENGTWEVVAASNFTQNGGEGQMPIELIDINAPKEGPYGVVVIKVKATRDVCLRLIAPSLGLDDRVPERSLSFPADSPDAVTVGAVDVNSPYPLEPFSSRGPTFGSGGSCSGGSIKPDIVAYDRVSTVSYGPGAFPGTSAAAPHVAGAAALLKERYPGYTAAQLQDRIESDAKDLGEPNKDNLYGAGRLWLSLDPEVTQFDIKVNAGWNLVSLCLQPESTGIETVLATISGKYISAWAFVDGSWQFHDPNNPGFSNLNTMEAGWGYWLNMNEPGTLIISGSTPSNSIDLMSGWNLVGYNSSISQAVADAVSSIEGKYVSIWAFINGNWKFHDPNNPGFSDLETFDPGYGYWINTKEACTWTLQ